MSANTVCLLAACKRVDACIVCARFCFSASLGGFERVSMLHSYAGIGELKSGKLILGGALIG